jgi:hypothetical protein
MRTLRLFFLSVCSVFSVFSVISVATNFYLIAWGLIGEPTARVIGSGGPQKRNS